MPREYAGLARSGIVRIIALVAGIALVALIALGAGALTSSPGTIWLSGTPIAGGPSHTDSVAGLMRAQRIADRSTQHPVHPAPEEEADFRTSLPANPRSPAVAQLP